MRFWSPMGSVAKDLIERLNYDVQQTKIASMERLFRESTMIRSGFSLDGSEWRLGLQDLRLALVFAQFDTLVAYHYDSGPSRWPTSQAMLVLKPELVPMQ